MKVLRDLPRETKLGLGLVNPKTMEIESESVILKRVEEAMKLFGADRVAALHPDCGFATFADNPVSSLEVARAKLEVLAGVAKRFR